MLGTMKAVRIHEYGGPEVLRVEDAPVPKAEAGELLIHVAAAGVNPVDWEIREGWFKDMLKHQLPLTLGWDFAGVVETVGPGVTGFADGEEVYGFLDLARQGCYANFVAVPARVAARMPRTLDANTAAAVPVAALTAWQALFEHGNLREGQTVLVHGGAGGVGLFAIQFAKAKGALVAATCSAENVDFVRGLGADQVIDYKNQRFEQEIKDIDLVLDTVGGDTQSRSYGVLKGTGALVATIQPPKPEEVQQHGVKATMMGVRPNAGQLYEIGQMIDNGKVQVPIDSTFPLEQARQAQERSQGRHARGKIVLRVSDAAGVRGPQSQGVQDRPRTGQPGGAV